jgi:mono/diheme cytochrome c family protein
VDPANVPKASRYSDKNCSNCHGERVPSAASVEQARQLVSQGGEHQTMPVWGQVLTDAQLNALVAYTLSAAKGTSLEAGQQAFQQNCAACHGEFGEGGPNPSRAGDIIFPISTGEYLKTRDDFTLRSIISQGQPNFGMSPFGSAFGGPLDDETIDAIVAFIRAWENNPPVELPPEIAVSADTVSLDAAQIYGDLCAQCHGEQGEGGIGLSFQDPQFHADRTDQQLFDSINIGHGATAMIGWGDVLSADQIQQLVGVIRQFKSTQPELQPTTATRFRDVYCFYQICSHGSWDGTGAIADVMNSGNHARDYPGCGKTVSAKAAGTQSMVIMPPAGKLPDAKIQAILDWIAAGAPEN